MLWEEEEDAPCPTCRLFECVCGQDPDLDSLALTAEAFGIGPEVDDAVLASLEAEGERFHAPLRRFRMAA